VKLLFCIKAMNNPGGGAERVLADVANGLVERGHQVAVLTSDPPGGESYYPLHSNIERIELDLAPTDKASNFLITLRRIFAMRCKIRMCSPDVVVGFMHSTFVPLSLSMLATNIPLLGSEHIIYDHYRHLPLQKFLLLLSSSLITRITCTSTQALLSYPSAIQRKMVVIRNSVAIPTGARADILGSGQARKVLLSVGRLEAQKDHSVLVNAFAQITEKVPDWDLRIVGDGALRAQLEAQILALGLANRVQLPGPTKDIWKEYSSAQLFVMPSRYESFGLATAEALSQGLPVIGFADCPGTNELVRPGENGVLVPPSGDRARSLAGAMLSLMKSEELRGRLAAGSKPLEEYRLERVLDRWEHVLRSFDRCAREELPAKGQTRSSRPLTTPSAYASSPKRPLMLAYWGRYGALPQLTLELAAACARAGDASRTTISISSSNELFKEYTRFGETIFPVDTYLSPSGALNVAAWVRLRRRVMEKVVADGSRTFVTLMPHFWSPLVSPMLQRAGIRHTVVIHDADPHLGDRTALINRWLLREAELADQVVTLTTSVAERLVEQNLVPEEKVSVLFHPDLTYPPMGIRSASGNPGPLRVLFFGRILPYKGLGGFVRAMEILKRGGVSISVGVFGEGDIGPERARLEALGAEVVNEWIDPKDIGGILGRYDVMVVSHTRASQSGVIAAAHGAGLPVVCTPVGGLTEQVVPEVTGLVAADVTDECIGAAIRRLAEDRNLLLRLRQGIIETKQERSVDLFFGALSHIALEGR
jgi:glycosyltransferase involved in cell wall biosynthesis